MELEVTKAAKKVLFVGEERICRQVAYVLGYEEYELLDELTEENYLKFKDYEIYVSEFKRKSKKIVAKGLLKNKEIKYLEDICRAIDKEYKANYSRNKAKDLANRLNVKSFFYNLLRSCWLFIKVFCTKFYAKRFMYHKIKDKNKYFLQYLKASELFLFVLYAPINKQIECSLLENHLYIKDNGDVLGCCSFGFPFGNIMFGVLDDIYHSLYARIVKLSSLNRSFCLCDMNCWRSDFGKINNNLPLKPMKIVKIPKSINIAIDRSCNLCCKSCRNHRYVSSNFHLDKLQILNKKIKESGYLDKTQVLYFAGQGEVFYSSYYRELLKTELKRKNIVILSNGTLFNIDNWNWLKDKYETIDVIISVDAATAKTYRELRGGDFNNLINNLEMLANLHKQGAICSFSLNFVVQRDNFHEMIEFVKLGKKLGVDRVEFQRMNNFGNLTKKVFLNRCLIIDDKYLDYELWQVLQDPIFKEPIVDLSGFNRYLVASKEKYENR